MRTEPIICEPNKCSKQERAAFIAVAEKSGEVERPDLESGFDRARFVLWASDARGLTGVAALKVPRKSYWQRVFTETNCGLSHQDYPLEFGYLYVETDRRDQGYGRALVQHTLNLAASEGVFATTREANADFHPFLVKQGFERVGQPYKSTRGNFRLLLFVRAGIKSTTR